MKPISIYCDWALHDELSDNVCLTEEMTMGVLDTLERWQAEHGVRFEHYLLDCFWFARPGDYRSFSPETWPNGFEPARKRMQALGMTPGLWLDVTGGMVRGHAPWADSASVDGGWCYCLFDGPYGQGLLEAMLHAVAQWGVRLFKFDFANFYAVTPRFGDLEAGEVYARNVAAFRRIVRAVHARHPDVVTLAYNAFAYMPEYIDNTTSALVPGVDPGWLDTMDYLYSGDPRPCDVPCASLRRAVDMYQDHMVRKFRASGIPFDRIDDHGCMVGRTGTIYWLGHRGWRRTWVQSLGRGSRKAHFYGDVHLLDDDDVQFLKASRALFFNLYAAGAETQAVGGVPCQSPWHGFLAGEGRDGLLVVVNSTPGRLVAELGAEHLRTARVLFHDEGFVPECEVSGGTLSVRLAPEQMALVGLGRKADEDCVLGANVGGDAVTPDSAPVQLDFAFAQGTAEAHTSAVEIMAAAERGGFDGLRLSFRLRDGGRACRHAMRRDQAVTEALGIEVEADDRPVAPSRLVPDVKVWSGCSWATGLYPVGELRGAREVRVRFGSPDAKARIIPEAWLQVL